METVTEQWFGEHFTELHPDLQKLHRDGGVLQGEVDISYGTGLGAIFGKRLGKKLGLPAQSGPTSLRVEIAHTDNTMIWSRQFGDTQTPMRSVFTPNGDFKTGHWSESTGAITLELGVEVLNGGWNWIQKATKLGNWTIPAVLVPELTAKKYVNNNQYHFDVKLSKRGLGLLVQYGGALELTK